MSENTKYQTDVVLQNNFENNNIVSPALYSDTNETVTTTSDPITTIDESDKSYSNITAPDGDTDIKVGSGYNIINVNNGNTTITAAGNAMNTINIGNANSTITVGSGQNTIIAGDGTNNITSLGDGISDITVGNGNNTINVANGKGSDEIYYSMADAGASSNTITVGDGINTIFAGHGSNTITTGNGGDQNSQNYLLIGDGDNTVTTGTGYNQIWIGSGINRIHLNGHDTVYRNFESKDDIELVKPVGNNQYVTISGGYSNVTIYNSSSFITDTSAHNSILVGANSIITGSNYSDITFGGTVTKDRLKMEDYDSNSNDLAVNVNNSTIVAATNLTIQGGANNSISNGGKLNLIDATGDTSITSKGSSTIYGANGLNLTLEAYDLDGDSVQNIFYAGSGNETLNAGPNLYGFPAAAIDVHANTVAGAQSSLVAIGNTGDDTLSAGTGNSTFTGGAGANLFEFTKADVTGGNTVITDFAASEDNQIALFNYGLTRSSLKQLLQTSQNDTQGNAVLNLDNHTITLQGVSVSDLDSSQFVVLNNK